MPSDRYGTIHLVGDHVEIIVPGRRRFFRRPPDVNHRLNWSDITRVIAFKRDCFGVDSIRLAFEIKGTHVIEVHEDMAGWRALVDAIPEHLPGALSHEEWFGKVAFPAFEPCPTTLYACES